MRSILSILSILVVLSTGCAAVHSAEPEACPVADLTNPNIACRTWAEHARAIGCEAEATGLCPWARLAYTDTGCVRDLDTVAECGDLVAYAVSCDSCVVR